MFRKLSLRRFSSTTAAISNRTQIIAPTTHVQRTKNLIAYYGLNSNHEVKETSTNRFTVIKPNHPPRSYGHYEDLLKGELFYKKKRNLHHYPLNNPQNTVTNFDLSPLNIITNHPLLNHLTHHRTFSNCITCVHNYGTFIRFPENKVQRLYWNPSLNAGIPLVPKEKDPIYELIFMLHSLGHLLIPDLIFTGHDTKLQHRETYTNYRLLSEATTVTINEMLIPAYLETKPEFHTMLKIGIDHPYKLYKILKSDLHDTKDPQSLALKPLFLATYEYFAAQNPDPLMALIDTTKPNWTQTWNDFHKRYRQVSLRGKEWTETNFDNMVKSSNDYKAWWRYGERFSNTLQFKTIKDQQTITKTPQAIFEQVWSQTISPLFTNLTQPIDETTRKTIAYKRYMLGNLFILTKYNIDVTTLVKQLEKTNPSQFESIIQDYRTKLTQLYESDIIDANEYHNAKNIAIMIPPNMLKKDTY